jgi:SAM-dependent methyltransferase
MASDARSIIYVTPPMPVSMADSWFEIANLDHFWVRRRFEVMKRLADANIRQAKKIAEVGCGNGLVQRYLEDAYGVSVAGFELNEIALKQSCSRTSPLYCYNIHQREENLKSEFDLVMLFDVLEHIQEENQFLDSIKYHMTKAGRLLINVPSHQSLFSAYDRAAGHVRRYSLSHLTKTVAASGFRVASATYWGMPLIPVLLARKALMAFQNKSEQEIISSGFDPGPRALNSALMSLSRCEILPQKLMGTSLMAVLERVP